jgi:hypothetical protein
MSLALARRTGTRVFHAAVIAHQAGNDSDAEHFAAKAAELKQLLLPSERDQLEHLTFPPAAPTVAASGTDNNKPTTK